MRVLLLHTHYREFGGEDAVFASERDMLRDGGFDVFPCEFDNEVREERRLSDTARLAFSAIWSKTSYDRVRELCRYYRPNVVHVHNFWLRLSPSVHTACFHSGVPTVQTLHNFRLLCANAQLYRNGTPCEDCIGRVPWRGVVRSCYRCSPAASAGAAAMAMVSGIAGLWRRHVAAFIALSEHSRAKFIAGGLPADRTFVKPNFAEDRGESPCAPSASRTLLYLGRLTSEKGVDTLLRAWSAMDTSMRGSDGARLVLAGDARNGADLRSLAESLGLRPPTVTFCGRQNPDQVSDLLAQARAVVVPSSLYENFPRVIVEAFAAGRPVIASDLGAMREIVTTGAGIRFAPGNAAALVGAMRQILADDDRADSLGRGARKEFLAKYTREQNLRALTSIYEYAAFGCRHPGPISGALDIPTGCASAVHPNPHNQLT